MNKELLAKLVDVSLLSEEVQASLIEAFNTQVDTAVAEKTATITEKLTEEARQQVEAKVTELQDELTEARNLEAVYADKLETFKEEYKAELTESSKAEVERIVAEQVAELKEDIEVAKQTKFGLSIYEAFKTTFLDNFADEEQLSENYREVVAERDELRREKKIADLTSTLQGRSRTVMEAILSGTSYERLDEKFEAMQKAVVETTTITESDKDSGKPLNEGDGTDKPSGDVVDLNEGEGGDDSALVESDKEAQPKIDPLIARALRTK